MKTYLNRIEPIEIATILREVKDHGFYSAHCANLVFDAKNQNELIKRIKVIAAQSELRVTFNAAGNICIFEA